MCEQDKPNSCLRRNSCGASDPATEPTQEEQQQQLQESWWWNSSECDRYFDGTPLDRDGYKKLTWADHGSRGVAVIVFVCALPFVFVGMAAYRAATFLPFLQKAR